MNSGQHIKAVEGPGEHGHDLTATAPDGGAEEFTDHEVIFTDDDWTDEVSETRFTAWILPTAMVVAAAGWTAFFGWAIAPDVAAATTPQQWTGWVSAWALPVLLIMTTWLLIMRHSTREAARFGDAARQLSTESALLEDRLTAVNRELSLARDFIAAQSRDLDSLGRTAAGRLSVHAEKLQELIHDNGAQVEAIAAVSDTAVDNMARLRDDLPVIANSSRDVSNQIGNAGKTAHEQIAELVTGFERLNDFGTASARQVDALTGKLSGSLRTFENQSARMDDIVDARFNALEEKSEAFRTQLDEREVAALAAMRHRADAATREIDEAREALDDQETAALVSMRARLTSLREESATVSRSIREGEPKRPKIGRGPSRVFRTA